VLGRTLTFFKNSADDSGRVKYKGYKYSDGSFDEVVRTYHFGGSPRSVSGMGAALSYEYNTDRGLLTKVTDSGLGKTREVNFGYHPNLPRRTSMSATGGLERRYVYDGIGRLKQLVKGFTAGTDPTVTYNYDLSGRMDTIELPNGVVAHHAYDDYNKLESLQYKPSGSSTVLAGVTYQRDNRGRIEKATFQDGRYVDYKYTAGKRLLSEKHHTAANYLERGIEYAYTENNTLKSKIVTVGSTITQTDTYSYLGPRLQSVVSVTSAGEFQNTYTYDLNGDRKTKTSKHKDTQGNWVVDSEWDYEYNMDRFLSRVLLGGVEKRQYWYQADNYKIARERRNADSATDIYFMRDGDSVLAEFDSSDTKTAEFFGNALDRVLGEFRGSEAIWNLHGLGGVMAVSDSGGSIISRLRYDAFGLVNPLSTTPTLRTRQRTFHGRPRDDYIGLVNFRNRWLDPEIGQFAQSDRMLDPHNWNSAYNFVDNDPINKSDPMGTMLTVQREEQAEQIASKFKELGLNPQIFRRGHKPYGFTVQLRGVMGNTPAKIKAARSSTFSYLAAAGSALGGGLVDLQSRDNQLLEAALSGGTSYFLNSDGDLVGEHPDKVKAMLEGAGEGAKVGGIAVLNATIDTAVGLGTLGAVDSVGLIPAPNDPLYGMAYGMARVGTELLAGVATGGLAGGAGTVGKIFKVMDVATNVVQTARNLGGAASALQDGNLGSAAFNLTMALVNGASVRGALGKGVGRSTRRARPSSRGGGFEGLEVGDGDVLIPKREAGGLRGWWRNRRVKATAERMGYDPAKVRYVDEIGGFKGGVRHNKTGEILIDRHAFSKELLAKHKLKNYTDVVAHEIGHSFPATGPFPIKGAKKAKEFYASFNAATRIKGLRRGQASRLLRHAFSRSR